MVPTFAFNGYVDELRVYSIAKTEMQMTLDFRMAIGDKTLGASIRSAQHWTRLFLYFSFDGEGKNLEGGPLQAVSMRADSSSTLVLGGGFENCLPQWIESTAPLFGASASFTHPMDGETATLVKIPIYGYDVSINVVRCRLLEPLPLYGRIATVEYDPRVGFGMGRTISFGKTILELLTTVESTHGIETCGGTNANDCSRQGYYVFYIGNKVLFNVVDEIPYELSASPFMDDKGNAIPTISVFGRVLVYARQLPLPVAFSEEIKESQARLVYLPYISRTDEALQLFITRLPASGSLHHVIEAPKALVAQIDAVQGHASFAREPYRHVDAPRTYCVSDAFSDTRILSADGQGSWDILSVASQLQYANCSVSPYNTVVLVDSWNGEKILVKDEYIVQICRYYLANTVCSTHVNSSCTCEGGEEKFTTAGGRVIKCLENEFLSSSTPLSEIRVAKSASYVCLAALFGLEKTLEWLLSIRAVTSEVAMELAAAAGHAEVIALLLQHKAPWNVRAINAARLRAHVEIVDTLEKARFRSLSGALDAGFVAASLLDLNDASSRCFLRGPKIEGVDAGAQSLGLQRGEGGGKGQVYDAECRLFFIPKEFDTTSPLEFEFEARRLKAISNSLSSATAGHWELNIGISSLSAKSTLVIIPVRDLPIAGSERVLVTGTADLIFVNFPMQAVEKTATRSQVLTFPVHGELFNVIELPGNRLNDSMSSGPGEEAVPPVALASRDKDVILGSRVAMEEDRRELLPVQVLNCTRGNLTPVPPGPWEGSLYHPPFTACTCKAVFTSTTSRRQYVVEKECAMQGAFERACGARGTDVLLLKYAHKLFPEEVVISSWLPDSCHLRVLAQHPPAQRATWQPTTTSTPTHRHFTSAQASSAGIMENRVTVSPSTLGAAGTGEGAQAGGGAQTKVAPRIDTVLTGCAGVWESLYEGDIVDIRDRTDPGQFRLPLPPPHFETDTLAVQVCFSSQY
jgi:hypothetical protein